MNKINTLSLICRLAFLTGTLATIFGYLNPAAAVFFWNLLIVSIGYLFAGILLFRGYYPESQPLLRIFLGYLYSSVFIAFTMVTAGWPLAGTFITITPVWLVALFGFIVIVRKKISTETLIQFTVEGSILLLLNIFLIVKG